MDDETFSTPDVARLTGATFRQIDYWSRKGYIVPVVAAAGSGSRRRWGADEVQRIKGVMTSLSIAKSTNLHRRILAGEIVITETVTA